MMTRFSGMQPLIKRPLQFKGLANKPARAAVSLAGLVAAAVASPIIHSPAVDFTTAAAATTAVVSANGLRRSASGLNKGLQKAGAVLGAGAGLWMTGKGLITTDALDLATGLTTEYVSARVLAQKTKFAPKFHRIESPFKRALDGGDKWINDMRGQRSGRRIYNQASQDPNETQQWRFGDSNGDGV